MAIEKAIAKRTLSINVKDGVTTSGADKFKAHNYPNVRNHSCCQSPRISAC